MGDYIIDPEQSGNISGGSNVVYQNGMYINLIDIRTIYNTLSVNITSNYGSSDLNYLYEVDNTTWSSNPWNNTIINQLNDIDSNNSHFSISINNWYNIDTTFTPEFHAECSAKIYTGNEFDGYVSQTFKILDYITQFYNNYDINDNYGPYNNSIENSLRNASFKYDLLEICDIFKSGKVQFTQNINDNQIYFVYKDINDNYVLAREYDLKTVPIGELYYVYKENDISYISKFIGYGFNDSDEKINEEPDDNQLIGGIQYKSKTYLNYYFNQDESNDDLDKYDVNINSEYANVRFFDNSSRINGLNSLSKQCFFDSNSNQQIYVIDFDKIGGTDIDTGINYIYKIQLQFDFYVYSNNGISINGSTIVNLLQPKQNYSGYSSYRIIKNGSIEPGTPQSSGEDPEGPEDPTPQNEYSGSTSQNGAQIGRLQKLEGNENLYKGRVNEKLGINSTFSRIVKFISDTSNETTEQPSSTELVYEDTHIIYKLDENKNKIILRDDDGTVIRDSNGNIQYEHTEYNDRVLLYIDTYNTIETSETGENIIVITKPEKYEYADEEDNTEYNIAGIDPNENIELEYVCKKSCRLVDNSVRYKKRYEIEIQLNGYIIIDNKKCYEYIDPDTNKHTFKPIIDNTNKDAYYGPSIIDDDNYDQDYYVNVSTLLNNIFIYIPISNEYSDKLEDDCAIEVTSNSVTDIDFINTKVKLYKINDTNEFTNITDGDGILCASFSKKSNYNDSDWGALSVYYGTDLLLNGDLYLDLDSENNQIFKYDDNGSLYFTYKIDNLFLYVYVHGITQVKLDRKIHILLSAPGSISNKTKSSDNVIQQEKIVLHELEVNLPLVTTADTIAYIDSSRNGKTHHYEWDNITELDTEFGKKYYGVRAYRKKYKHVDNELTEDTIEYFPADLFNLGINGLTYNVPAKIVLLNPISEQRSIYSFKNGEQYLTLDQVKVGLYPKYEEDGTFNGEWERINNSELLPSYKFSYAYLVEGLIPGDPVNNYNITFSNLVSHKELKKIENKEDITENSWIYFSYTNTETKDKKEYVLLTNDGYHKRLISETYSEKFIKYDNNDLSEEDKKNVYERIEEYTKLSASSLKIQDFYETVINSEENSYGESKYYKYVNNLNTYIPYIATDVQGIKNIPLNLYTLSYVYRKIAPDDTTILEHKDIYWKSYTFSEFAKYDEDDHKIYFTGEQINKTNIDPIYYKKDNAYIPYRNGFIKDGSVKYYGYKYNLIDKEWINNILNADSQEFNLDEVINRFNNNIYLKHNFKSIGKLTKEQFIDYYTNGIKLYVKGGNIKYINVDQNSNIYIIDVSGNTVYADANKNIIPIDIISKKYYELLNNNETNSWTNIEKDSITNSIDDEVKNNLKIKNLNFAEEGNEQTIKYIIDFSGEYLLSDINITTFKQEDQVEFYLDGTSYVKLNLSSDVKALGEYNSNLKNFLNSIKDYKVDLYKFNVSKLDVNDLLLIDDNFDKSPWNEGDEFIKIWVFDDRKNKKEEGIDKPLGRIALQYYNHKVKSTGLIINEEENQIDSKNYFFIDNEYELTYDLHMSKNKNYYEYTDKIVTLGYYFNKPSNSNGKFSIQKDSYGIPYVYIPSSNRNWSIEEDDKYNISYYSEQITYYTYSPENYETHTFQQITDDNKYSSENYLDNLQGGKPTNILFLKSRYFYNTYTFNNGLNIARDGSYYTNISVFDGDKGKAYKTLFLSSHIYTVTRYTYMYEMEDYFTVSEDADLTNVLPERYSDYYIKKEKEDEEGVYEFKQLNEYDNSPAYYKNLMDNGNSEIQLSTRRKFYASAYYEGANDLDNGDSNAYQMFDRYTSEPVIIKYNNNLYGLIFRKSPYIINNDCSTIVIDENTESFVNSYLSKYVNNNSPSSLDDEDNITVANELYYNDYSNKNIDIEHRHKINIEYYLNEYDFEIVEVKPTIFRENQQEKVTIQDRDVKTDIISVDKPFTINNEKKIEFTGTYSWIKPKFGNITGNNDEIREVILQDGYWQKDYEIKNVPFEVSSYNFYPKDSVSSISITYNFIPNSYILTANIEHPEISYDYMVNEMEEKEKYSYIVNGFEYEYPVDSEVTFEDGSYYGLIQEHIYTSTSGDNADDPDSNIRKTKVKLYKRKELSISTKVKNIVHQSKFNSYEYFTYNQATPLTNEKVPILYNTELIPATTKKVQFWDSAKNSYSIKTVIDSYAYYSYKYIYDTIPFKVASYVYTGPLSIGNFTDLGTYVSSIGDVLGESISQQKESINNLTYDLSNKISNVENIIGNSSDKSRDAFNKQLDSLIGYVDILNTYVNERLQSFNETLNSNVTNFTYVEENAINKLSDSVSNKIQEQHDTLKVGLDHGSKIMENKFEELNNTLHEDLIGDGSSKNITTKYESVTYTPIYGVTKKLISGYKVSRNSGEENVTLGGSSLGEILSNSFSTTMEYTKTTEHEDGSYTMTTYRGVVGLGEILSNLTIQQRIPNYNEFMVDLVPKLFSAVDFEGDYDIEHDVNGNIIEKKKRNPTDLAKKCIMRADILWTELKKKGIVS